jgi:hypothetical protein
MTGMDPNLELAPNSPPRPADQLDRARAEPAPLLARLGFTVWRGLGRIDASKEGASPIDERRLGAVDSQGRPVAAAEPLAD